MNNMDINNINENSFFMKTNNILKIVLIMSIVMNIVIAIRAGELDTENSYFSKRSKRLDSLLLSQKLDSIQIKMNDYPFRTMVLQAVKLLQDTDKVIIIVKKNRK